jgi:hypothetical protein
VTRPPEVKISEVKPVIMLYVEKMSQATKARIGVELNKEQKTKMVESILSRMEAQDIYDFVDP